MADYTQDEGYQEAQANYQALADSITMDIQGRTGAQVDPLSAEALVEFKNGYPLNWTSARDARENAGFNGPDLDAIVAAYIQ